MGLHVWVGVSTIAVYFSHYRGSELFLAGGAQVILGDIAAWKRGIARLRIQLEQVLMPQSGRNTRGQAAH